MGRNVQAILIAVAAFILVAVVILFVLIEMPTHDTATWEALNGRYLGHWRVAPGEDRRFPAFVAGHEDLRIEEVGAATGPGTHGRDVVVSWNGAPYRAWAESGPGAGTLPVRVIYADAAAARSYGFSLTMLTLQFDGMIEALESIEIDDPEFDHLFIDFRALPLSMTSIDGACVRYERVNP